MDTLPDKLTPLCFNRHEFTKASFDVDRFLAASCTEVSLEKVKADLHTYLKIIQNAMIELINKDYAEFVNLSTHLVTLRTNLVKLKRDLADAEAEVEQYSGTLSSLVESVDDRCRRRTTAIERQFVVQREIMIAESFGKFVQLVERLDQCTFDDDQHSSDHQLILLDRIELQLAKLNCGLKSMQTVEGAGDLTSGDRKLAVSEKISSLASIFKEGMTMTKKPGAAVRNFEEFERSVNKLQNRLNMWFKETLSPRSSLIDSGGGSSASALVVDVNVSLVNRLLSVYRASGTIESAREIFLDDCLRPLVIGKLSIPESGSPVSENEAGSVMEELLNQLQAAWKEFAKKFGLNDFGRTGIAKSGQGALGKIRDDTSPTTHFDEPNLMSYKFLLDSILTFLLRTVDAQFQNITIPGEAKSFHICYQRLIDWPKMWGTTVIGQSGGMEGFDLESVVASHPTFTKTLGRFNLSVFHQLVVLHVQDELDVSCSMDFVEDLLSNGSIPMEQEKVIGPNKLSIRLQSTGKVFEMTDYAWSRDIYLSALADQSWNLQCSIYNRYCRWANSVIKFLLDSKSPIQFPNRGLNSQPSSTNANFDHSNTSGDSGQSDRFIRYRLCMILINDLFVIDRMIGNHHGQVIDPLLSSVLPKFHELSPTYFDQLKTSLVATRKFAEESLIDSLAHQIATSLAGVSEIPRQYRWTRKDRPTCSSVYVRFALEILPRLMSLAAPAAETSAESPPLVSSDQLARIVRVALSRACGSYRDNIRELRDSVDKMSSSLSKLKRSATRPKEMSRDGAGADHDSAVMTDDDKIKLQLELDVKYLIGEVGKLPPEVDLSEEMKELKAAVGI